MSREISFLITLRHYIAVILTLENGFSCEQYEVQIHTYEWLFGFSPFVFPYSWHLVRLCKSCLFVAQH